LAFLSDKQVEVVQNELKEMDYPNSFGLEQVAPGSPKDYEDLDRRSRFRIISTSPSLDPRIKASSCVQIQHVATEMYLSYETMTSFAG